MADDLYARHLAVSPAWVKPYYEEPIEIVRGEGRHVWDGDGRKYLDLFGGILTTMTAHALPEVVEAIREQAGRILHSSTLYLIRPMVELAERIAALSPIPDAKVFFTSSGTEATDAALLLATTYRRSNQVLALRNSYHGRSLAALAVTGNRSWSASSLSPLQVSYVNAGVSRGALARVAEGDRLAAAVDDLHDVIDTTTSGDVACFMAEPIQGVGGFTSAPEGFLAEAAKVSAEHGILFVADEVQTGWGRTGDHFWGIEAEGVTPDLLTFAKGLGNGLAIGGVVARAEVMDCLGANSISTFGGNPLSTAGALANLEYLLAHDLQGNARRVGSTMITALRSGTADLATVSDVRGKGLMIGLELVRPGTTEPDAAAAAAVLEAAKRLGGLVGKGGLYGNVLRIAPPMTITDAEAAEGVELVLAAVREVVA